MLLPHMPDAWNGRTWIRAWKANRSLAALGETLLLFAPGLPAYLWLCPRFEGSDWHASVQVVVYLYLLAGAVWIGRRRWSWSELGFNGRGVGVTLACGAALLLGRTCVILSVNLPLRAAPPSLLVLAGDVAFYLGLVGLVEELVFRGLVYRALDEWRGTRWALWGSTFGFTLFHVAWYSPLELLGAFLIGMILGTIRWRAGGIVGLILVHAAIDLAAIEMVGPLAVTRPEDLGRPEVMSVTLLVLGYALILGIPLYLWKFYRS